MTLSLESVRVRVALPGDAPAMAALLDQLGYPTTVADTEARLARLTESAADHVLVAERASVGVTGLVVLHRAPVLHRTGDVGIIMALVVDERRRGEGVGERLVRWAAALARDHGCAALQVTTHHRRDGAHRFYERLGFEHTGRRYVLSLH
ncbi:MAG TPA: GNAT family N-acetyltransferase [Gemmatimonadaceae bacterium]|nr:GNAT family N-acetyltransferase [Gemmatimonadaceae bacterium]